MDEWQLIEFFIGRVVLQEMLKEKKSYGAKGNDTNGNFDLQERTEVSGEWYIGGRKNRRDNQLFKNFFLKILSV